MMTLPQGRYDERQTAKIVSDFFLLYSSIKSHKNRKMLPTIHRKYKYFHSTVQTAEDRQQKSYLFRWPFDVLNLSNKTALRLAIVGKAKVISFHRTVKDERQKCAKLYIIEFVLHCKDCGI